MRKILPLLVVVILIFGGCSPKAEPLTWENIYKMVDDGEFNSRIDQAIYDIGPETHPASTAILEYYNACYEKDYEKAWGYIEPDSPFMENKESLNKFTEIWEESFKLFEYNPPIIKGVYIDKEADGKRDIEIIFSIDIKTIGVDNEYSSNGRFIMTKSAVGWKIFDFISEVTQE